LSKPYQYTLFRWGKKANLEELEQELSYSFQVKKVIAPVDEREFVIDRDRDELRVEADTLKAYLTNSRALLFQKEDLPFTVKDMELREAIKKYYPHNRPTPLPIFFQTEPKFRQA
jgi:hypothetical protein